MTDTAKKTTTTVVSPVQTQETQIVQTTPPIQKKPEQGTFAVQVSGNSELAKAQAVQSKLKPSFTQPVEIANEGGLYKVRITGFKTKEEAIAVLPKLEGLGYKGAFIVVPK